MRFATLFSGVGGPEIAAERLGWEHVFTCEIDDKARSILQLRYPEATHYDNIFNLDGTQYRGQIDIITGGFPCQPFSHAGKRRGDQDERYLWEEMLRVCTEIRPTWIIGENVAGLLSMESPSTFEEWIPSGVESPDLTRENYQRHLYSQRQPYVLDQICQSIEQADYQVQTIVIPACASQAWHRRDRVWIIAYDHKG